MVNGICKMKRQKVIASFRKGSKHFLTDLVEMIVHIFHLILFYKHISTVHVLARNQLLMKIIIPANKDWQLC